MNISRANSNSAVANPPSPVSESEVAGAGSSQAARPGQPQPTAPSGTGESEQVRAFLSRVQPPPPDGGKSSSHASSTPALPLRPLSKGKRAVNPFSETGSKIEPLLQKVVRTLPGSQNRNAVPWVAERPKLGINDMPPEVLQDILYRAVSLGSTKDQIRDIVNMTRVSKNFKAQVLDGPLKRLYRLVALRTQYRQGREEVTESYAYRLKLKEPSLTAEEAAFVASNEFVPSFVKDLSISLEFQPAEVQRMIAQLKAQFKREPNECDDFYAVRLKHNQPDLTLEHASLAVIGYDSQSFKKNLLNYLHFQPAEVKDKVADLRTRHPGGLNPQDMINFINFSFVIDYRYPRQLMKTDPKPLLEHAAFAAWGRAEPGLLRELSRLLRIPDYSPRMHDVG